MIRKVVIANRGEIAVRVACTLREMGIHAAGVFTQPDRDALHAITADEAHEISSYLSVDDIVDAARRCGADAIHPGYGFLSENAALPRACDAAGIVFIGPQAETIRKMGDKLESKRTMRAAGVPVVPSWSSTPGDSDFPVLVKAV